MRKTVSGENRKLLSTDQSGQTIDCGDTGTDIITRIFTGDRSQTVDRVADTVEGTSQDLFGKTDLHRVTGQTGVGVVEGHIVGTLENLDHGFVLVDLYNSSQFLFFPVDGKFYNLFICCIFDTLQNYQRTIDFT